jgi:putative sugar O-methyltransferase
MESRVLLADNLDFPAERLDLADQLRRRIGGMVEQREAVVRQAGLDPAFCLPDANWELESSGNDFVEAYRHLSDGGFAALNRLRFWVHCFTGYHVMSQGYARGYPSVAPVPADLDAALARAHPRPDRWVERWRRAVRGVPPKYRFAPKPMLGEIGWRIEDVIVNYDTHAYQERLNLLYAAGVLEHLEQLGRPPRILEIGGGYGALAYALRQIFPAGTYVICDLPESLLFSGLYLLATLEEPRLIDTPDAPVAPTLAAPGSVLVPNYLFHRLVEADCGFDLVINTLSLSEMSEHQIDVYCRGIAKLIGPAGLFFEQNKDDRWRGLRFAMQHVREHFAQHRPIRVAKRHRRHGFPNLWANGDIGALLGNPTWRRLRLVLRRALAPAVGRG